MRKVWQGLCEHGRRLGYWVWSCWWGLSLVVLAGWLRLWGLGHPSELYFDEAYHVPAIVKISQADWSAFEWWHSAVDGEHYFDWLHPPLAKYIQAGSVWFGREVWQSSSAWWWRLPSALAGIWAVWLVWAATKMWLHAQKPHWNLAANQIELGAAIAGLVAATDGLWIVMSRIGMNDAMLALWVSVTVWLLVKILIQPRFFWQYTWVLAVVAGLAVATKWSGVWLWLGLGVVLVVWALRLHRSVPNRILPMVGLWVLWLGMPVLLYLLSYLPVATSHGGYGYVWQLHQQIMAYHLHRDDNHRYASAPWQWVLNARPVWLWTDTTAGKLEHSAISQTPTTANIYALSHPLLPGLLLAALCWWGWQLVVRKMVLHNSWWVWGWLYGIVWLPWWLSPRIMFYYHYLPALPIAAVLLGVAGVGVVTRFPRLVWWLISAWLVVASMWLPLWLGLRVPKLMGEAIYFALSTWR